MLLRSQSPDKEKTVALDGLSPSALEAEGVRIREVYARRLDGNRYSWFNPGHVFIVQSRERRVLASLKRFGCVSLDRRKVLEIGCGTGHWLREFIRWGAQPENIVGVELLPDRVAEARRLCPGMVNILSGNAAELGFATATFDLVLQSTVFTSILDYEMRRQVASEMLRVMKPDGLIVWYDFYMENPRNPDVRAVKKREIYQLFIGCQITLERLTLAPPIVRFIAPYSWLACDILEKIPWLCTHYLGIIRKG